MHRIQDEAMTTTYLPATDQESNAAKQQEREAQHRFTILSTAFPPPARPEV